MWMFNSGVTITDILMQFFAKALVLFSIMPLTQFARGFMAYKLGDPTAKQAGRLTLNPIVHLDLIGSIAIFLCNVGWPKYLPINPSNFKKPRRDSALVALAGPISNFLVALLCGFIVNVIFAFLGNTVEWLYVFFSFYIIININLMVLGLLPIPGFSGGDILEALIPEKHLESYYRFYDKFVLIGPILTIVLIFTVFQRPLALLNSAIYKFILTFTGLFF